MSGQIERKLPKIEKGIPIPTDRSYGRMSGIVQRMQPGDSILVPGHERSNWASIGYRFKYKMSSRTLDGGKTARIWRIK